MNNIHEKDWAEESWAGHTGMDSGDDYCVVTDTDNNDAPKDDTQQPSGKSGEKE